MSLPQKMSAISVQIPTVEAVASLVAASLAVAEVEAAVPSNLFEVRSLVKEPSGSFLFGKERKIRGGDCGRILL